MSNLSPYEQCARICDQIASDLHLQAPGWPLTDAENLAIQMLGTAAQRIRALLPLPGRQWLTPEEQAQARVLPLLRASGRSIVRGPGFLKIGPVAVYGRRHPWQVSIITRGSNYAMGVWPWGR